MLFETKESYGLWIAIVTSICGVMTALITSYFLYKGNKDIAKKDAEIDSLKKQHTIVESELQLNREALELKLPLEKWARVHQLCDRLFHKTSVERILFLRGWNGADKVKFATAIHQMRSDRSVHFDYIHYPTGDDYNEQLRRGRNNVNFIIVKDLDPNNEVARLYNGESPPITEAAWGQLREKLTDDKKVLKDFISMSTFAEGGYKKSERNLIRRVYYELQGIFNSEDE